MELTDKAVKEIEKLRNNIVILNADRETLCETMNRVEYKMQKYYRKDINNIMDRIYKAETKIECIQAESISTSERNSLSKEAWDSDFIVIERDKSLGMVNTTTTKIGFSKVLKQYVRVRLVRYSGFMSNVKGCASLANKREMNSFEIISKEEYDSIIAKNERKDSTSFYGYGEKILPIKA